MIEKGYLISRKNFLRRLARILRRTKRGYGSTRSKRIFQSHCDNGQTEIGDSIHDQLNSNGLWTLDRNVNLTWDLEPTCAICDEPFGNRVSSNGIFIFISRFQFF